MIMMSRVAGKGLIARSFASLTVRDALNAAMVEEMTLNPKVFLMGEEVGQYDGAYKVSRGLLQKFGPRRVVDCPITEHGFTGLAVGAAMGGLHPICEFMTMNFSLQAIDQIVNSAAKTLYMSGGQVRVPVVFRGPNGAAVGVAAQHSQDLSPWYASVPGLYVISPWSATDAKGLLKAAIRHPGPVMFLENELLYGQAFQVNDEVMKDDFLLPIGKAEVVREGTDITLIAHSKSVDLCLQVANELQKQRQLQAEVINLRTLKPLDFDCLAQSIKKTNYAAIVEGAWEFGGIAAEISAQINGRLFDYLDGPVLRIAGKNIPMPYAASLEAAALPTVDEIVKAILSPPIVY